MCIIYQEIILKVNYIHPIINPNFILLQLSFQFLLKLNNNNNNNNDNDEY